jgi:hypothetical protein
MSEARSFPGLDEWTGFCPNVGQTEGASQPGREDIGRDPQPVPNFTTAAENFRQFLPRGLHANAVTV